MKLEEIKEILALMESHDLAEVEIEEEGRKIRLKKAVSPENEMPVNIATPAPVVAAVPQAVPPAAVPAAETATEPEKKPDDDLVEITSPMVGTFYSSSTPDAEPFVSAGDRIKKDMMICIIEAMKVMNEIKAEVEGELVKILVENGEALEYGQPMMLVRPPGAGE